MENLSEALQSSEDVQLEDVSSISTSARISDILDRSAEKLRSMLPVDYVLHDLFSNMKEGDQYVCFPSFFLDPIETEKWRTSRYISLPSDMANALSRGAQVIYVYPTKEVIDEAKQNISGRLFRKPMATFQDYLLTYENVLRDLGQLKKEHLNNLKLLPMDGSMNILLNGYFFFIQSRQEQIRGFVEWEHAFVIPQPGHMTQHLSMQYESLCKRNPPRPVIDVLREHKLF